MYYLEYNGAGKEKKETRIDPGFVASERLYNVEVPLVRKIILKITAINLGTSP